MQSDLGPPLPTEPAAGTIAATLFLCLCVKTVCARPGSPLKEAMSAPTPAAYVPTMPKSWKEAITPYLAPYYLAVAGVLGAITTVFVIVIALLILVAANFNVLGLIE